MSRERSAMRRLAATRQRIRVEIALLAGPPIHWFVSVVLVDPAGGLRLLVASHAVYEHTDEHYAACGIDIRDCRLSSYKNLMNFRKLLDPGVDFIAIHGPGGTPLRLQDVEWQNRVRPFWPADDIEPPTILS